VTETLDPTGTARAALPAAATVAVGMRGASVVLGGRTIWSGVDLDVAAGEFVAVLGPNGSGKSTLLRVLLGLIPARGTVQVLGARPGRQNSRIGYVPQRKAFDPGLRIRGIDIVALGLDGSRWGTPLPWLTRLVAPKRAADRRRRLENVIELVGATEYARRPIGRSSGGEQQRLLIAQALLRRPELLLLDEPLESLDVPSQAGISALVRDICRKEKVAVIMVAHDVNPILPYLDRVVYVGGGTAVSGSPQQVITADNLTALYGVPIDVLRDRAGRLFVVGQPDVPADHVGEDHR
jgi:zinc/manganese transport system ATP-binding protein